MVALTQKFKVDDPTLQSGPTLIDEGQYKAVILKSDWIQNKNKNGHFIALTVVIVDGANRDTEFTDRLNIDNPNEKAVKIAYKTLADISKAVGLSETPDNTEQLHNKPFMIDVVTEKGTDFEKTDPYTGEITTVKGSDSSRIKKYLALPAVGVAGQPQAFTGAQQQQAPAVTQPQPSEAPQQAATGQQPPATPSWAVPTA